MQNLKCVFLVFLCSLTELAFAYSPKEGNVTANLGPFIYQTHFKGSIKGASSPKHGGIGFLVNGDVNDKGALEIAMFHMNKIFFREENGLFVAEETDLVHITMGYRRYLSNTLSASLALYSSYTLGDPRLVHSDFSPGQEIDTSARDVTEYGLDLAIQYEIWQQDRYSVVFDARYAYSVTNKFNESGDHYGTFLSLRYFVQEKEDSKRSETNK